MLALENYEGREQTFVKHFVLEQYLERLAWKIGYRGCTLTYVDCFAGPWKSGNEQLQDTSPFIALNKLREAQKQLAIQKAGPLRLRALFIEEKSTSATALKNALDLEFPKIETKVLRGKFEDVRQDVAKFCASSGTTDFTFYFVDPTGWTGYAMDVLAPLVQLSRSEVLVNFMTGHIARFIDLNDEDAERWRSQLFGFPNARESWAGLSGMEREERIVETYCNALKQNGKFEHVVSSIVLNPLKDRTHFHLILATKSRKGLEVFREVEQKAIPKQELARDEAKNRKKGGALQQNMFAGAAIEGSPYVQELRKRYLSKVRAEITATLTKDRRIAYEVLLVKALSVPMCGESDLKNCLKDMRRSGQVEIEGLKPRESAPKADAGHFINWTGPAQQAPANP